MKSRVLVHFLFAVFLVTGTALVGQTKPATMREFTGTEMFDPLGILGTPVGHFVDPGTVACPGADPTGDPLQPCPAGGRTHARDATWVSRFETTDPLGASWGTIVANANLDADFTGAQWGTFSLAVDSGGTWEGNFEAVRVKQGDLWVSHLHATAKGVSGQVDGLKMMVDEEIVGFTAIPIVYVGTIQGRIVVPSSH